MAMTQIVKQAYESAALSGGLCNSSDGMIRKETALEAVQEAAGEVRRIEERLFDLTKKLVGDLPLTSQSPSKPVQAGGLLGELEGCGHSVSRCVSRMDDMLNAIERALP
jgi:hypothetical protein